MQNLPGGGRPPPVPPGWVAEWNGQYRAWYYVNLSTNVSQWEAPNPASSPPPPGPPPHLSGDAALAAKLQAEEDARAHRYSQPPPSQQGHGMPPPYSPSPNSQGHGGGYQAPQQQQYAGSGYLQPGQYGHQQSHSPSPGMSPNPYGQHSPSPGPGVSPGPYGQQHDPRQQGYNQPGYFPGQQPPPNGAYGQYPQSPGNYGQQQPQGSGSSKASGGGLLGKLMGKTKIPGGASGSGKPPKNKKNKWARLRSHE
ncbi:unnamed protein product [Clonostachys solani]|uniref:WW domain-containing protein n=1 Tax=Clonostachys solani TaxID=160281 RepID=A0A9P0EQY7_9HYPO|nr:unnamed protein product [Clonostachys solani]